MNISRTSKEIITGYRNTVFLLHTLRLIIDWTVRHGLPVHMYMKEAESLKMELLRFEDILNRIQDRPVRNVLCCRFALGMSIEKAAEYMNTSTENINRLTMRAWKIIREDDWP